LWLRHDRTRRHDRKPASSQTFVGSLAGHQRCPGWRPHPPWVRSPAPGAPRPARPGGPACRSPRRSDPGRPMLAAGHGSPPAPWRQRPILPQAMGGRAGCCGMVGWVRSDVCRVHDCRSGSRGGVSQLMLAGRASVKRARVWWRPRSRLTTCRVLPAARRAGLEVVEESLTSRGSLLCRSSGTGGKRSARRPA
jgi:hypothetical protein